MKKALSISIAAILTLLLSSSCTTNPDPPIEIKQVDFSQAYISETDYDSWDEAYAPVLSSWRQAISEDFGSDYSADSHGTYPYIPEFDVSDWLTADTFYAYCDIDASGSAELIVAGYEKSENWYYIFDIYALMGGEPVRLLEPLTRRGFGRDTDIICVNPGTDTLCYRINDGEFKHCSVYCRVSSDGCSAQFIEAYDTWQRDKWTYYSGSLSLDNAREITSDEGNRLLEKYSSKMSYQSFLANLVWRELAPSAISKNAFDYLDGYQPMPDAPEEYAEVIELCRKEITVYNNVHNRGYCGEILYELLDGSDTISFETVGEYPGGGLWEPVRHCDAGQFGYALHDINHDGTSELLFIYTHENGAKELFDIFTLCGGQPTHLLDFQSRNYCTGISGDGHIFRTASGGAACQSFYAYTISSGGESLNYEAVHRHEDEYTYFSAQVCMPGDENHGDDGQSLSAEEGEKLISRLTDEDCSDDDVSFAEFIPLF